jgi:hypothetical protein
MKVKLNEDYWELYEGSVIQDVVIVQDEGVPSYYGLYCSRAGSYRVIVPVALCSVYDPEVERVKMYKAIKVFFDKEDKRLGYLI